MTEPTKAVALQSPEASALEASPRRQSGGFNLEPKDFGELWRLCEILASTDMVPKDFKGKPANCLIAIQWGFEVGLKPMQSLQNIAVINGRPSMWGDSVLALVRSSPLCEYVVETMTADGTAQCQVKRRGEPEQVRTFSDLDAKTAGLTGKDGPWKTSPKRMKQMRARAFALRDVFADVLKGIAVAEEALDLPPAGIPLTLPSRPAVDAALLTRARDAADAGKVAFAKFWASATPGDGGERDQLRNELDDLKRRTEAFEAKPKVERVDQESGEISSGTDSPTDAPEGMSPETAAFVADMERAEGAGGHE